MPPIPEFILRKLYVKDSLKIEPDGFSFALMNSYAPAKVTAFELRVDGPGCTRSKLCASRRKGSLKSWPAG